MKQRICKNIAIVLAGGNGSRMMRDIPKQYMNICEKPVLSYSLQTFNDSALIDGIIIVAADPEDERLERIVSDAHCSKNVQIAHAGDFRYESVNNALQIISTGLGELYASDGLVFVHDSARACITTEMIARLYDDAKKYGSAVASVPSKDTVKISSPDNYVISTPDRDRVHIIQTPQVFETAALIEAYNKMISDADRGNITDDAMVMENYSSVRVHLSEGDYTNIKLTTPEDITFVERILLARKQ